MKKKLLLSLLTLTICASLFIGCKDDTTKTDETLSTEPTAEEQVLLDLCDLYIKCNDFESANTLVENHYGENTFFKKSKNKESVFIVECNPGKSGFFSKLTTESGL